MLQLFLAALLASAAPATSPPVEAPTTTITGDPAKDAPLICLKMVSDKVEAALAGKPPISAALTLYSIAFELSDEQKGKLERDCWLFERGFMIGVQAEREGRLTVWFPQEEKKPLSSSF